MFIKQIVEPKLAQHAYLIGCSESGTAIIVDPLRDIDRYQKIAAEASLRIVAATETHIHADYLSGLREFAEQDGVTAYASDEGDEVWKYHWLRNSDYRYQLLRDGDRIKIGNITLTVASTPGHTPEHVSFMITDGARNPSVPMGIVTGDFVFVGDVGRPDLLETAAGLTGSMAKSASVLYRSLRQFKDLPPELVLWPGHGAGSACGRSLGAVPVSTVGYELHCNPAIQKTGSEKEFVDYILDGQPEPPPYFARMKELNRIGPPLLERLPVPKNVDAEDIDSLLGERDLVFVDTRTWEAFKRSHLPGALFIPTTSAFSTLIGSYIDPDFRVCLIVAAEDLDESIRHCIRVGVDRVEYHLEPPQLKRYFAQGGAFAEQAETDAAGLQGRLEDLEAYLVDVRRASELAAGKIRDAYNIAHAQLRTRCGELPKERTLYVYCETGSRSRYAAAFLSAQGYRAVDVAGGLDAWRRLESVKV